MDLMSSQSIPAKNGWLLKSSMPFRPSRALGSQTNLEVNNRQEMTAEISSTNEGLAVCVPYSEKYLTGLVFVDIGNLLTFPSSNFADACNCANTCTYKCAYFVGLILKTVKIRPLKKFPAIRYLSVYTSRLETIQLQ